MATPESDAANTRIAELENELAEAKAAPPPEPEPVAKAVTNVVDAVKEAVGDSTSPQAFVAAFKTVATKLVETGELAADDIVGSNEAPRVLGTVIKYLEELGKRVGI